MTQTLTKAQQYRLSMDEKDQDALVDVTLPSGNVFKFYKPSKYGMIFGLGSLPQQATSGAVEHWQKLGILSPGVGEEVQPQNAGEVISTVLGLRDKVLRLSYDPKLVVGPADESKNELSTDHVSDEDLDYLFKWVATGGDASAMLAMFPEGQRSGPGNRPNRKARRGAAVKTRRSS